MMAHGSAPARPGTVAGAAASTVPGGPAVADAAPDPLTVNLLLSAGLSPRIASPRPLGSAG